jgi:hypothetical protein
MFVCDLSKLTASGGKLFSPSYRSPIWPKKIKIKIRNSLYDDNDIMSCKNVHNYVTTTPSYYYDKRANLMI